MPFISGQPPSAGTSGSAVDDGVGDGAADEVVLPPVPVLGIPLLMNQLSAFMRR